MDRVRRAVRPYLSTGGDCVISLRREALGKKSEFYAGEIEPIRQPLTIAGWEGGVMSRIVRRIKWIAAQCAAIALVALATNLLASAGALPSHSVAVIQPNPINIVDRSGRVSLYPSGGQYSASARMRIFSQSRDKALAFRSRMEVRHLIRKDKLLPSSIGLQAQNVSADFSPLFGGKGEHRHFGVRRRKGDV